MKKFFSLVLALVMALSLTTVAWGATTTTVSNTDELQAALDKATDGDTIYLTTGVNYGVVYLGRPNANNVTKMVCNSHPDQTFTDAAAFKAHMNDGNFHHVPYYTTELSNITIVGAEGATVAGFVVTSDAGTNYDYVLGVERYRVSYLKLSNLTFENVAFTGKVDINSSLTESEFDGVTFNGCSFTTGGTAESNGMAIRYYNENNDGNVKNLVVNNCSFYNCRQGVYTANVKGVTVTDCTFDTLGHNAVAVQSGSEACDHGNVVIAENKFENVGDRVIRFNNVGAGSDIIINNNVMEDCGDDAGELIKASSVDSAADVDLESNYWDGKDVSTAVVNFDEPAVVGITGGTWDTDVSAYVADGYRLVNGTVASVPANTTGVVGGYEGMFTTVGATRQAITNLTKTLAVAPLDVDEDGYYNRPGDRIGSIEYYTLNFGGAVAQNYYRVDSVGDADLIVYVGDSKTPYMYLANEPAGGFTYVYGATVFNNFGKACGQFKYAAVDTTKTYYAYDGKVYVANPVGDVNLMVGGNFIQATDVTIAGTWVAHVPVYTQDKTGVVTAVKCANCPASAVIVANYACLPDAVKADDAYFNVPGSATKLFYWVDGVVVDTETKVESAETFDAGIAMYVGMSDMAAAGSAVVIGKKKD